MPKSTGGVQARLRRVAFGDEAVDLGLLPAEVALRLGQCRHGLVLTALRSRCGLVGPLLRVARRRLYIGQFGASAPQISYCLLKTDRQRLPGGSCGDHVLGAGCREIGTGRAVDVCGRGEAIEALLSRRDRGVGVGDRLRSGVDIPLCSGGDVARLLQIDDRLVHTFLPRLDGRAQIM